MAEVTVAVAVERVNAKRKEEDQKNDDAVEVVVKYERVPSTKEVQLRGALAQPDLLPIDLVPAARTDLVFDLRRGLVVFKFPGGFSRILIIDHRYNIYYIQRPTECFLARSQFGGIANGVYSFTYLFKNKKNL